MQHSVKAKYANNLSEKSFKQTTENVFYLNNFQFTSLNSHPLPSNLVRAPHPHTFALPPTSNGPPAGANSTLIKHYEFRFKKSE